MKHPPKHMSINSYYANAFFDLASSPGAAANPHMKLGARTSN